MRLLALLLASLLGTAFAKSKDTSKDDGSGRLGVCQSSVVNNCNGQRPIDECHIDIDCPSSGQKCCGNGCSMVCTSNILKPGHCPRRAPKTNMPSISCTGDGDCGADLKCCGAFGRVCQPPQLSADFLTCPTDQSGPCNASECVNFRACNDQECTGNQICCGTRGCCTGCVEADFLPAKSGCPLIKQAPLVCTTVACDVCHDDQCPTGQKCCRTGCCEECVKVQSSDSSTSTTPKPSSPAGNSSSCPSQPPANPDCAAVSCRSGQCAGDADCVGSQVCCTDGLGCCFRCYDPATKQFVFGGGETTTDGPSSTPKRSDVYGV